MEEWEKHIHLGGGKCFEMYFSEYGKIIRFKINVTNPDGYRKAINCETGEYFEFNAYHLLKRDYSTLIEVKCENCKPPFNRS